MKKRMKEMEQETAARREMQAKLYQEWGLFKSFAVSEENRDTGDEKCKHNDSILLYIYCINRILITFLLQIQLYSSCTPLSYPKLLVATLAPFTLHSDPATAAEAQASREEVDSQSVSVGNGYNFD
ncbi:uncharacterized protein LOC126410422 [Nymphaea colorata]|nr:uncharacterized protein LOC126410422 [Nymphaea colorata]